MSEWTNVLITYVRKQLLEITLPVQRTSTYIKQVVKPSKLSDSKTREEWVRKFGWSYVDVLLRQYSRTYRVYLAWTFCVTSFTKACWTKAFL
jgi:hypothetical protein